MYKTLFFILRNETDFVKYFSDHFLPLLSEINGKDVKLAKVESNILSEIKFSHFCEIEAASKDDMDIKMNSAAGRKLGKLLLESHQNILVLNISYE
jgi:hypothetical protein